MAGIQMLEFPADEINDVLNDILGEDVQPFPWKRDSKVNGGNAGDEWEMADAIVKSDRFA